MKVKTYIYVRLSLNYMYHVHVHTMYMPLPLVQTCIMYMHITNFTTYPHHTTHKPPHPPEFSDFLGLPEKQQCPSVSSAAAAQSKRYYNKTSIQHMNIAPYIIS
jgi:hypothetical protein